ncbi:tRNA-guanine(15) transglycosylase-like protein [Cytidiella melzeri]|nr:tRNA-guanine(15) transglycosylase-like protein [Cytidiella melzeri]
MSTLSFTVQGPDPTSQFAPRLGRLVLKRHDESQVLDILTPALITTTSRGIVPHLSRNHVEITAPIGWTQVHFETFLERTPPVPAIQNGAHPLHTFLGYRPEKQLIALSLRDPHDGQEMPPNTKDYVSCRCVRGVRKVTPAAWRSYALACKPDIVTALSDIPFTLPPHSQKRIVKSIERSTAWLADILRSLEPNVTGSRPHILVGMAGGNEIRARTAFAEGLVEPLYGKDADLISPLNTLDVGVSGYVFDLVPLRTQLVKITPSEDEELESGPGRDIAILLKASLAPLPLMKPRIVHSARHPHDILRLVQDVGVDLFDARFAQYAADVGVALDFTFPVRTTNQVECSPPRTRQDGRIDLGHNLFSVLYAHDHSRLATSFAGVLSSLPKTLEPQLPVCLCAACSPQSFPSWIKHSEVDIEPVETAAYQQPFSRAYIHHLLQTHEMSSHALLAMHNLTVMDAFFAGIREVLSRTNGLVAFRQEVSRFCATCDEDMLVFDEARIEWAAVERARGKGRLQREKSGSDPLATPDV